MCSEDGREIHLSGNREKNDDDSWETVLQCPSEATAAAKKAGNRHVQYTTLTLCVLLFLRILHWDGEKSITFSLHSQLRYETISHRDLFTHSQTPEVCLGKKWLSSDVNVVYHTPYPEWAST